MGGGVDCEGLESVEFIGEGGGTAIMSSSGVTSAGRVWHPSNWNGSKV